MEFELTKRETEDGCLIWKVESKGLQIGTLVLNKETKGYDYTKAKSIKIKC